MIDIPRATAGKDFLPGTERDILNHTPMVPTGYVPPRDEPDTSENLQGIGAREFPSELWIEPREWKDFSDWLDDNEMSAEHGRLHCGRPTAQPDTHECTMHSGCQGVEAARRAASGFDPDDEIWFSPISIYAIANPGKWGGAGCQQVLSLMIKYGLLPEPINGQDDIFDLTLHGTCGRGVPGKNASGPWVTERRNPEYFTGAKAKRVRKHFKPIAADVINPRTREEMVCLVLHKRVVNVGRRGHAVPKNRAVWLNKSDKYPGLAYPDSYTRNGKAIIRIDSWNNLRQEVSGASCIWSMNDYQKPE